LTIVTATHTATENAMRIHAIQTGRVQIKKAQIAGHGHGLWRQIQPIISGEWAEWVPVYAWASSTRRASLSSIPDRAHI
jgi:hypothetical protein